MLILVIVAAAGLLVAQTVAGGRRAAEIHAETTARNLAMLLASDVSGAIAGIDLLLQSALREIDEQQARGGFNRDALDAFLTSRQALASQIIALRVTDANGLVRFGAGVREAPLTDLSDRAFFIRQRDDKDAGLVITSPVLARISKTWVVPLSRRLNGPDGRFAGIVYANVALDYLAKEFAGIDAGPHGAVVLYDGERTIFARSPDPKGQGSAIGLKVNSPQIIALMEQGRTEATYRATSTTDGIFRTYSYTKVNGYPLYLMVGLAEDDYLAGWRLQRMVALGLYAGFCLVVAAVSATLWRVWRQQAGMLARLSEAQQAGARTLAALRDANAGQRATNARLLLVLESVAEGIIGLGEKGQVIFANPAAVAILGYPSVEAMQGQMSAAAVGHRLADGSPCSDGTCAIRMTLVDGKTRRVEKESFLSCAGGIIPVEYVVGPLVEDEAVVGAVLVFHDISRRRAMEAELQRSNAELEAFAYAASHDLRQPLRTVTSYLGLIERRMGSEINDDIKDFMDFATAGAKRMDRLILDLLDYSRIGRQQGAAEPVPLRDVVDESLTNLAAALAEAGATVEVADGLPTVAGYRGELVRLFQNLVGNAVKYRAADRTPAVEIDFREAAKEWVVWVKDNGIGIAPEDRERAFQVFQRLANADGAEGTGIGLSVCRKVVQHHGGRIWIDSAVGEGACFFIAFPKT